MKPMILFLVAAAAVSSTASSVALADYRERRDARRDNEQRRYESWERQRDREAADAKQGGRSGPGAIGDQPYKNPRPEDKPARALRVPEFKK